MIDPRDYAAIEGASAPAFSQDGGRLFFLRGAGQQQIWCVDLQSGDLVPGKAMQLTWHDEKVGTLRRAPGDDRVAYTIDAGGDERHQVWLLEDGASRALTSDAAVVHGLGAWSPDGSRLSLSVNDRDAAHFDLVVLEVATGARERLQEGVHEAVAGGWSADGRVLFVQDRNSGDQRPFVGGVAVPRMGPMRAMSLRWDGIQGKAGLLGLIEHAGWMALCRLDPATGAVEPEYAPEADVEAWALSSAGLLATVENNRGCTVLRVGPRGGERAAVDLFPGLPGVVSEVAWSGDGGRLAFAWSGPGEPSRVFVWEAGRLECVVDVPCALPMAAFGLVEWPSFDGATIPGWFATPAGAPPASGWPSVVWVHGGPASQARANFRADMQALVAQGYAVLMPNVRGSTGYGRAWMDADDVELRLDSVRDLAAGHAWLVAQPGIDPARVAVMGQSYGGYMVLAAITENPELWRCAIDFYGIGDFVTLLETTSAYRRAHRAAEYGDPVRHRALFDRISPIRHFDRVRCPVLVLHGERDPRVGFGESTAVVAALEARGVPVEFEVFDYAGHGFLRAADRARAYAAVGRFLAAHL